MVALYSDENQLLKEAKANPLADQYINEDSFRFSKDDDVSAKKLFETRHKIASSIKKERLKPYLKSAVPLMNADERKYWQSLFSEIFIAELYQYNFYCALNRKQLLQGMSEDLKYYQQQLTYIESFNDEIVIEQPLWKDNQKFDELLKPEECFSPSRWCCQVLDKITTAWNAFLRDCLDELNWYRLYWVWAGGAGGFLGSILDLDSVHQWHGRDNASDRLESPDKYCAYASWVLYATRLTLHLSMTAKHVIPNPWMSDAELEVDWTTRLLTQIEQRYQRIGNDIAWGYVNYASAYWYTSALSPSLGAFGGFLNVALMSWDCLMAYIKLSVETKKYNDAKSAIENKLQNLSEMADSDAKSRAQLSLQNDLKILEINWKYDKQELEFILSLAITFIPAMALMFAPMFPIYFPVLFAFLVPIIPEVVFVGCLISVLLTAYETYYCANLCIDKSIELMNAAIEKMQLLNDMHQALASSPSELTNEMLNELRLYHLENKRLMLKVDYLKKDQAYQHTKMIHSIAAQFVFPAVVFASLFMAITPAVVLIVGALLVALVTKLIIDSYKPKEVDEFANKEEEGFEPICLTEEEYSKPQLPFFKTSAADNNDAPELINQDDKKNPLEACGLFSTSHNFVATPLGNDMGLAM